MAARAQGWTSAHTKRRVRAESRWQGIPRAIQARTVRGCTLSRRATSARVSSSPSAGPPADLSTCRCRISMVTSLRWRSSSWLTLGLVSYGAILPHYALKTAPSAYWEKRAYKMSCI